MKRLTIPRARRPLKARVSAVGASPANAARCGGLVPASGVSIRAAADLSGRRAGRDDAGDSLAVGDPARGDERQVGRVAHELEQGEEADGRRVGVVERALVTARL